LNDGYTGHGVGRKKDPNSRRSLWADVEGDIENENGVLKITHIRVKCHLKVAAGKSEEAKEAFSAYLVHCPAAQSVIGCIKIQDELIFEEIPS